jgi:predicted RNA-binding Zn-ribbon protein involved in translation (DUF1610 family)
MAETPEAPAPTHCPSCDAAVGERAHRCPACGEPLTDQARTARSSNNLVIFILVVLGLAFATVYYMRARQRSHSSPPGSMTPTHSEGELRLGAPDANP